MKIVIQNIKSKTFLVILLAAGLVSNALAKEGDEHVTDMQRVFGVDASYVNLTNMFWEITRYADRREPGLTGKLQAIAPKFSEGRYSHRIYFHWGFFGEPKHSPALVKQIDEATKGMLPADAKRTQDAMYKLLRHVSGKRMSVVSGTVKACCTDPNDRSKALKRQEQNALAALAYDVHLIGDYIKGTEKTKEANVPLKIIYQDIENALNRIRREDYQEFTGKDELNACLAKLRLEAGVQPETAAGDAMLLTLSQYVPVILRKTGRVKRTLGLK